MSSASVQKGIPIPEAEKTGRLVIGIEGGATRTVALAVQTQNMALAGRLESGPANVKLLTQRQLVAELRTIAEQLPPPSGIAIGLAGAWAKEERERIRAAATQVWPRVPCYATHDLETALSTADLDDSAERVPKVLLTSGTGSGCYGKKQNGEELKIGSWGHILGDKGSAYEIGLRSLKASVYYYDQEGKWSALGARILRSLQLNEPKELIDWTHNASKAAIAQLATEVFESAKQGEKIARDILAGAADSLARDAATCARRIGGGRGKVQFILAGGNLTRQPQFAATVTRNLRRLWPNSQVICLKKETVWGAVALAMKHTIAEGVAPSWRRINRKPDDIRTRVRPTRLSPTEQRNRRSLRLDKMSTRDALRLMLGEESLAVRKILKEESAIAKGIEVIAKAFRSNGRLFYVGAGTSGRLGILDASECPPTFRTSPELVQGLIAGGQMAVWRSVEGAEDDSLAGARAIQFRNLNNCDVVVGIAASGTTPFVWGALAEAKGRGAKTILVCFNPYLEIAPELRPDIIISPDLGPEVLTGSTRLKAGTATKLILNAFTTLAMAQTGKVMSNLMVDMAPSNTKLRDRATRMVMELTGVDYDSARSSLARNGWRIKSAVQQLRRRLTFRASEKHPASSRRPAKRAGRS